MQNPQIRNDNRPSTFNVVAGVGMFIMISLLIISPRASPLVMPIIVAFPIGWAVFNRKALFAMPGRTTITPLVVALGLFGIYLMINASWSVTPGPAFGKIALYIVFIVLVFTGSSALKITDSAYVHRLGFNLFLAFAIFGTFLVIEIWFGAPIRRAILSLFPQLIPSMKHTNVVDGVVRIIGAYTLNRSIATLCMIMWPVLAIVGVLYARRPAVIGALFLLTMTIIATLNSEHETSILSLGFSAFLFLLALWLPRTAIWLAAGGWVIATMLVVPIALGAYSNQLHFSKSIPITGRARIILWGYTAEQVLKRPALGVGVQSTRAIDEARTDLIEQPEGFVYPRRTSRHSHNVYLQAWYELGAIGALLLCIAGLALLRHISRVEAALQPYVLATFVCSAVTAAFSWGLWQPWFMAAFALNAFLANLAIKLAAVADRRPYRTIHN